MVTAQELLQTKYVRVTLGNKISEMLGAMRRARADSAAVFSGKSFVGMIEKRFLLNSRVDLKSAKVGNVVKRRSKSKVPFFVPHLAPDADEKTMAKAFVSADARALPVIEGKKLLGIVHQKDLAKALSKYYNIPCDDIATMTPIVTTEDAPISKAITLMVKYSIDHLPIVDENDKLSGMLSLTDLIQNQLFWHTNRVNMPREASHQGGKKAGYGTVAEKRSKTKLPVKIFAKKPDLCVIAPRRKVKEAIDCMAKSRINSIVLARFERPVGLLTIKDVLKDYWRNM